jgi:hypothetical protein
MRRRLTAAGFEIAEERVTGNCWEVLARRSS